MVIIKRFLSKGQAKFGVLIISILLFMALFAPVIAPHDPYKQYSGMRLQPPSKQYWFGTDEFGRDLFSRIIYGSRISLKVGVISVSIALIIGTIIGLFAGFYGGKIDLFITSVIDIMLSFPSFILALAIVAVLGPSLENAIIAIGIRGIPTFGRLVRSVTLRIKEMPYIEAGKSLGSSNFRLIVKYILPNSVPIIIVQSTLYLPVAILMSASLSFIGLGAQPPLADWGTMLASARTYIRRAPWIVNYTGVAIVFTVMGFNLLGNALHDLLDPHLKR